MMKVFGFVAVFFVGISVVLFDGFTLADFVPGKVRTLAKAEMQILRATGVYKSVESISVEKLTKDASDEVKFVLLVNNDVQLPFVVTGRETSDCSNIFTAELTDELRESEKTTMKLVDLVESTCDNGDQQEWTMDITTRTENAENVSTLKISGNPEYFAQTLDGGFDLGLNL